jgi:hypothetical protein
MQSLAQMENRLKELEAAIKETEARLPAHSVKPPVMIDLLALEDEYETLRQQIRAHRSGDTDPCCSEGPASTESNDA